MTDEKLPKLNLLQISIYVADLLLISDGSIEAVRQGSVRRAWHIAYFSAMGTLVIGLILPLFNDVGDNYPLSAILIRIFKILILCGWLFSNLSCRHTLYLLNENWQRFTI